MQLQFFLSLMTVERSKHRSFLMLIPTVKSVFKNLLIQKGRVTIILTQHRGGYFIFHIMQGDVKE